MGIEIVFIILVYFFSIVVHEVAHGAAAYALGDPTAKDAGRLTLNPLPHIDPVGTIILPLMAAILHTPLFGWARPVPYNPAYFKNIRAGTFFVAIAGVAMNLALAVGFGMLLRLGISVYGLGAGGSIQNIFAIFSLITIANLVLGIFNLFPIPPLDGSKVLSAVFAHRWGAFMLYLESYGFLILLLLIFLVPGFSRFLSFLVASAFSLIVGTPYGAVTGSLTF